MQRSTAQLLMAPPRGILAADESVKTMNARLGAVGLAATEENRRSYREMLITTPELARWISGVILCDETFHQRLSDGRPFAAGLTELGIATGIKVDAGTRPLTDSTEETMTTGLESLAERLAGYAAGGACFAKWRAVIRIAAHLPTAGALNANARALACYAAACQEHGLVPIVEPEVLATGEHRIDRCAAATTRTLDVVFAALGAAGVRFPSMLLKPNMVTAGLDCPDQPSDEEVAEATLHTLRATVPDELGGVAFLSGGARPEVATARLAAICAAGPTPWPVTFSFGRALVDPALRAWADDPARTSSGQLALASRAAANAAARSGQPAPI